jgi:hypothetical protein
MSLWLLVSSVFTAIVLQYPFGADGCSFIRPTTTWFYMLDGLRRLDNVYQSGPPAFFLNWMRDPPHAPLSWLRAFLSFLVLGIHAWAPYVANGVIILTLVAFTARLMKQTPAMCRMLKRKQSISFGDLAFSNDLEEHRRSWPNMDFVIAAERDDSESAPYVPSQAIQNGLLSALHSSPEFRADRCNPHAQRKMLLRLPECAPHTAAPFETRSVLLGSQRRVGRSSAKFALPSTRAFLIVTCAATVLVRDTNLVHCHSRPLRMRSRLGVVENRDWSKAASTGQVT